MTIILDVGRALARMRTSEGKAVAFIAFTEYAMRMAATLDRPVVDVIEGEARDHAEAERIEAILTRPTEAEAVAVLIGPDQEQIALPAPIYRALRGALEILSRGDAIVIGSVHHLLTTTQAADLLGISRQYLIRLIDQNEIEHEMTGRHRRLRLGDVLAYQKRRAVVRRKSLTEMHALDVELGAYD